MTKRAIKAIEQMEAARRAQWARAAKPQIIKFSFGPSLLDIECGRCGESSDAQDWCVDRYGHERELNHFQCPRCSYAFKVVKTPPGSIANHIEAIQPTL